MAESKTIKLLLSNGSLSGLLVAELSKWDGILLSSPRSSYLLLSDENESNFWGVYLLVSDDQVYVGQANDLLRRINEHDKTKEWWTRVILITTKNNSFNRSDIDFLESKLIDRAQQVKTLEMKNIQRGNSPKVDRYRKTELKDFLDGTYLMLELIGIKVFTEQLNKNEFNFNTRSKIIKKGNEIDVTNKAKVSCEDNKKLLNTKSKSKLFLQNKGYDFRDGVVSYAKLQEKTKVYWINPNIKFIEQKWYLILNNIEKSEMTLLEIPANSLSVASYDKGSGLKIRADKPYYIDLNIDELSLIDKGSNIAFYGYVKKIFKY